MQIDDSDKCLLCLKVVKKNQKSVCCNICDTWVHFKCTHLALSDFNRLASTEEYYYCRRCMSEALPFNYLSDDFEFVNLLLHFFNGFPIFSGFVPNAQQLSLLNNNVILLDDEIDPDVNSCRTLITPCNYYLPNEIADRTEESQFASNLSLIHINARSMVNKLVYIELLLTTIKNDFDILAISETWENNLNT